MSLLNALGLLARKLTHEPGTMRYAERYPYPGPLPQSVYSSPGVWEDQPHGANTHGAHNQVDTHYGGYGASTGHLPILGNILRNEAEQRDLERQLGNLRPFARGGGGGVSGLGKLALGQGLVNALTWGAASQMLPDKEGEEHGAASHALTTATMAALGGAGGLIMGMPGATMARRHPTLGIPAMVAGGSLPAALAISAIYNSAKRRHEQTQEQEE